MRKLMVLAVAWTFVGCTNQSQNTHGQIVNYETKGNLQGSTPVECVEIGKVTSLSTPADIYSAVVKCIDAGEYERAVYLYALGGVYGRFDTLRVSDSTAHQAVQVLQINNFGRLTKEQNETFKKVLLANAETGSKQFTTLCSKIRRVGYPRYFPTYMIQHGMNAVLGSDNAGINADFDPEKAWEEALTGYLHCP